MINCIIFNDKKHQQNEPTMVCSVYKNQLRKQSNTSTK